VRRLPAVEALGSETVICTDKTGTLMRNEMSVTRVLTADDDFSVSGAGYAPQGGFARNGAEVEPASRPDLLELARAGLLCNDAVLTRSNGDWRLTGDPTEGALVSVALKAGLDDAFERENCPASLGDEVVHVCLLIVICLCPPRWRGRRVLPDRLPGSVHVVRLVLRRRLHKGRLLHAMLVNRQHRGIVSYGTQMGR
jgi:hypothetical protein